MTPKALALSLLLATLPLSAGAQTVPETLEQVQLSFAPVVKAAAPAVVNIYATRVVAAQDSPFAGDPVFERFFQQFGTAQPQVQNSLGSGVIVAADGIVVTNYHVVGQATEIRVVLNDRREFAATVMLGDEEADLAVLRLQDASGLPVLPIRNSDEVQVGDLVLAIGNPFGVGQTVSSGIVSGLARSSLQVGQGRGYFIQTDAAINPGNSGGALIDANGNLLGINTAIYSRSGGSLGIGFAIPVTTVKSVMDGIIKNGHVVRGYIGVEPQDITPELAESFGLKKSTGAIIAGVLKGGPADKAGMQPGDILVSVEGKNITDMADMLNQIAQLSPGTKAKVVVLRRNQETNLNITVGKRPRAAQRSE